MSFKNIYNMLNYRRLFDEFAFKNHFDMRSRKYLNILN